MAASLVPCVRRLLPNDPEAADLCRQVAASVDAVPLWGKCHIVQPWEQALKEIGDLLPRASATGGLDDSETGASRFQWLLVLDTNQPDDVRVKRIIARACKRLKSGKWSSGKHIDMYSLLAGTHDALLGARDMEVKTVIKNRVGARDIYYTDYDRPTGSCPP
jgi:hypothetical protein